MENRKGMVSKRHVPENKYYTLCIYIYTYPKNPNPKFLSGLCRNLGFSRDHEEKDVFFQ